MTEKPSTTASRHAIDQDPKGISLSEVMTLPEAELAKAIDTLPRGQLAVEGLPTVGAAAYPVDDGAGLEAAIFLRKKPPFSRKFEQKSDEKAQKNDPVFRNQAQIMAHASQRHAWRCGESLSLVAIPRFWPETGKERYEDHRTFDALGVMLDSKVLENPEFVGRLSSKDGKSMTQEEAIAKGSEILERHEAWKKDAVASQQQGWAEKETTRRTTAASKPNPCLGF